MSQNPIYSNFETFALYRFPKRQILDSSKLKVFADEKLKLDENGEKFSKRVENIVGKGEITLWAISSFPTVFSEDLYCRHMKTRAYLGKVYQTTKF